MASFSGPSAEDIFIGSGSSNFNLDLALAGQAPVDEIEQPADTVPGQRRDGQQFGLAAFLPGQPVALFVRQAVDLVEDFDDPLVMQFLRYVSQLVRTVNYFAKLISK